MSATPASGRVPVFADEFDDAALDTDVWVPHYLPAWSSRAASVSYGRKRAVST